MTGIACSQARQMALALATGGKFRAGWAHLPNPVHTHPSLLPPCAQAVGVSNFNAQRVSNAARVLEQRGTVLSSNQVGRSTCCEGYRGIGAGHSLSRPYASQSCESVGSPTLALSGPVLIVVPQARNERRDGGVQGGRRHAGGVFAPVSRPADG